EVIFGPALAERVTRYFARLATVRPPREEPFQFYVTSFPSSNVGSALTPECDSRPRTGPFSPRS
ncbi:hypothetical protein AB0J97_51015, partial [Nonomuraea sp. NPDC049607]